MLIAKITDTGIVVGYHNELFPDTSFSSNGPNDDWFVENNCKKINLYKTYDNTIEKLVPCEPYLEGDWVYMVQIQALTNEEIAALVPTTNPINES